MNVQPKPSIDCLPTGAHTGAGPALMRHVPAVGPRLLVAWPVEFEVEPWRP